MENKNKILSLKQLIQNADCILIGAGAGLSTSAGLEYSGERFEKNFVEFIKKYGFEDMYTASFYDFKSQEEKWAFFAKYIYINDVGIEATKLYKDILKLVNEKEYFVITTNVDDQFEKAGFNKEKIFATQGSYKMIQCAKACHNKLYDASDIIKEMIKNINQDLKIPKELVPKCPVCGGNMEVNLRKDAYFVQDDYWYKQDKKYAEFLDKNKDKKVLLLELGVGFNTPGIIRFPFEQMTYQNKNWNLSRINKENVSNWVLDIDDKLILIKDDIETVIDKLGYNLN